MFRNKAQENESYSKIFNEAAVKNKGQGLLYVVVPPTGRMNSKFLEAIGVKESDYPVIRIFDSGKK